MQQVIASASSVLDHTNRRLTLATAALASYPGHALIAARLVDLLLRRDDVGVGLGRVLPTLGRGHLLPPLPGDHVGHALGHLAARHGGAVEVDPPLQHAVA